MTARRLAAGFLAGASIVAGFLAILLLFFISTGVWTLLHDTASQTYGNVPFSEIFGLAFGQMLATLPRYFWSARWAMLALGCLGLLLALVERRRLRIRRPWRNRLGFVVTVGAMVAVAVAFQFANRLDAFGSQVPQLSIRSQLALGNNEMIIVGSVVGLLLALPIWFAWIFWYQRWSAWLRAPDRQPPSSFSGDDYRWREHQQRMAWLKTGAWDQPPASRAPPRPAMAPPRFPWLLAGLVAASILINVLLRWYSTLATGASGLQIQAASAAVGLAAGTGAAVLLVVVFELAITMNWSEETLLDE